MSGKKIKFFHTSQENYWREDLGTPSRFKKVLKDFKNKTRWSFVKIKLDAFEDHGGMYLETYNEKIYKKLKNKIKFVQDDISVSKKEY